MMRQTVRTAFILAGVFFFGHSVFADVSAATVNGATGRIDGGSATGIFCGGGVVLSAEDLRRIAAGGANPADSAGDPGGPRGGGGAVLLVECNGAFGYSTIQGAIESAVDGDVVVVLPNDCTPEGRWFENIDFLGKAIRVQSANPGDPVVVEATVIASASCGIVVSFKTMETHESELDGFVLVQADGCGFSTIMCAGSGPTIRRCRFPFQAEHHSFLVGIRAGAGPTKLVDCDFVVASVSGNHFRAIHAMSADMLIEGCLFQGFGGRAVDIQCKRTDLTNCSFTDNPGGALRVWSYSSVSDENSRIENCLFQRNGQVALKLEAEGTGSAFDLLNCRFFQNTGSLYPGGGAVWLKTPYYSQFHRVHRFVDCQFVDNTSTGIGGAIAVDFSRTARLDIDRCRFVRNHAAFGGGAIATWAIDLRIEASRFVGNSGGARGGALYLVDDEQQPNDVRVANCELIANSSGRSMAIETSAQLMLSNCTIRENFATSYYPWVTSVLSGTGIHIENTILWNNGYALERIGHAIPWWQATDIPPESVAYSIGDSWVYETASSNSDADPLFGETLVGQWTADAAYDPTIGQTMLVDQNANWQAGALEGRNLRPTLGSYNQTLIVSNTSASLTVWGDVALLGLAGSEYEIDDSHLSPESPAIDAGNPDFVATMDEVDIDGEPRVMSCRVDIGADEITQGDVGVIGDFDGDGAVTVGDLPAFLAVALNPPGIGVCRADVNGDGLADGRDVAAMVGLILDP